jgi:predicted CoA-binding protein
MMEVFRNSDELENVAREVIEIKAKVLWGQTRVFNKTAA